MGGFEFRNRLTVSARLEVKPADLVRRYKILFFVEAVVHESILLFANSPFRVDLLTVSAHLKVGPAHSHWAKEACRVPHGEETRRSDDGEEVGGGARSQGEVPVEKGVG